MEGAEAPAVTRAVVDGGQHFAEVTVFLESGQEGSLRGPARKNRQEALKDCLELRKVAVKNTDDPGLFAIRQRKKELASITWTMKDLGGRMLEGAEGPPPGFGPPSSARPSTATARGGELGRTAAINGGSKAKYRGIVKGTAPSQDSIIEVADIRDAISGCAKGSEWESKVKVALQQAFKRFGPVTEVSVEAAPGCGEAGGEIARVRFASVKTAYVAMTKASRGFLQLGEGHVRVRQPSAAEAVWRSFPQKRNAPAIEGAPSKKKLRPNERFAHKHPVGEECVEEADEAERFWEAQRGVRGTAAAPLSAAPEAELPEAPPPEMPQPTEVRDDESPADEEARKGEEDVARQLAAMLEKPFSQQRKVLKQIRLQWHPDKNPERQEVATRVFQFIQAHDAWLACHALS